MQEHNLTINTTTEHLVKMANEFEKFITQITKTLNFVHILMCGF